MGEYRVEWALSSFTLSHLKTGVNQAVWGCTLLPPSPPRPFTDLFLRPVALTRKAHVTQRIGATAILREGRNPAPSKNKKSPALTWESKPILPFALVCQPGLGEPSSLWRSLESFTCFYEQGYQRLKMGLWGGGEWRGSHLLGVGFRQHLPPVDCSQQNENTLTWIGHFIPLWASYAAPGDDAWMSTKNYTSNIFLPLKKTKPTKNQPHWFQNCLCSVPASTPQLFNLQGPVTPSSLWGGELSRDYQATLAGQRWEKRRSHSATAFYANWKKPEVMKRDSWVVVQRKDNI